MESEMERRKLIARLRWFADNTGDGELFAQAADMLEADAVPQEPEKQNPDVFTPGPAESTKQFLVRGDAVILTQQEPVAYQYRWTNPSGDSQPESMLEWKEVIPAWNQTVQQKVQELESYRYAGKPTYETRAIYAAPQPQRPRLTDEEIEDCYEAARKTFTHSQRQVRGQQILPSDSFDWHYARAIEAKVRGEA